MATKQKLEQVQQNAEDLFLDEQFSSLDTRGLPIGAADLALIDLRDPFAPDEKFAPIDDRSRGFGSLALKNGIAELADSDVEVQKILREHGVEDEAAPHKFYMDGEAAVVFLGKDNIWRVTVFSDGSQKTIKCSTAKSREEAQFGAQKWIASKHGPTFHELTEEETLTVSRMCTQGQLESALMTYLLYKCGEVGFDFSTDPRYLPATNEAAFFVFKHSTPDFVDGPEVQEFLENYIGDRPVSLPVLRAGFAAYKEHKKAEERGLIFGQIGKVEGQAESGGPTYEQLDDLDTEEIERLRRETLRLRAKQVRSGVLQ